LSNEIVEIRKMTYAYRKKVIGNVDTPPPLPPRRSREPAHDPNTEK
jgi:hypothetical protein